MISNKPLHSKTFATALLVLSLALLWGCETQPTEVENYQPEAALQAYLVNGLPLTQIYLERVAPLQGYYNRAEYGITGAEVIVYPLDGSQDTLRMVQHSDPDSSWIYVPVSGQALIPKGKTRYHVEARKASEDLLIWAETIVPDTFSAQVIPAPLPTHPDTLDTLDRDEPNLYFTWSESDSAGGYVLSITCLTPVDSLVPLDPDFVVGEDELDKVFMDRTGFWTMRYDQREQIVPWFMFGFVGWHHIQMQAVAAEYYDYLLSIFRYYQGLPIELESNVHGGLGMVAGVAQHDYWLYMVRVE